MGRHELVGRDSRRRGDRRGSHDPMGDLSTSGLDDGMDKLMVNLGAGNRPFYGWKNVDTRKGPGIDYVQHLDGSGWVLGNMEADSVDRFAAIHVLEHFKYPLEFMYRCWYYAKDGARFDIVVPHGNHDEAWADPTHQRPMYEASFVYYAPPMHWMNPQSGYDGDWTLEEVYYVVSPETLGKVIELGGVEGGKYVKNTRNAVEIMHVVMRANKPAREKTTDAFDSMTAPKVYVQTIEQMIEMHPEFAQFHVDPSLVFDEWDHVKDQGIKW